MPRDFSEIESHTRRVRQLYGAAYTVSRNPLFDDQTEIFRDSKGLAVYENPDVLPRVWTIHRSAVVNDFNDVRRHLQDPGFDLKKEAFFFDAPPAMQQCDGDIVEEFARGINAATVTVDMKCRGMVVISENNARGWVALIDGKPTPIYGPDATLRGIVAGAGIHKIETRYRPLSVRAGAFATLLA